jgi:hypothetical protein
MDGALVDAGSHKSQELILITRIYIIIMSYRRFPSVFGAVFFIFPNFFSVEILAKFYIKLEKLVEITIDKQFFSKTFPNFLVKKWANFTRKKKSTDLEGAFNP